mmetsp:Transcript_32908/g.43376  ORF Transcript_32908/g.43376 Transcript_32908/m.43376 type:complete len:90 (+) Transcript_32908:378-647(+)|eukprot:CAMPEP_0185597874 /NCGR_PEP_ID=MMETSP0434-20130131/81638_1 /TAXON_ID=626734 ORGANISM="Favella taraikaensis, Strain Fe Narragansett Bay" /NCGR_SAMPLE_ID=MMETSP0434 /ASSEMBLY_ACC=CAM_ASM_000379 /LENGTH=89 /DNA_ID=CAMNT_0028226707 /DNA_START=2757 /DNA_END=3026 /DNA_ORIENTATION=-
MRSSRQSSLLGDCVKDEALSSIKENGHTDHNLLLPQDHDVDFDNVPPTFRGQPDRPNQYFSLTENPQNDRKQENYVDGAASAQLALLDK